MKKKLLAALCLALSVFLLTACAPAQAPTLVTLQKPEIFIKSFEMRKDGLELEVMTYNLENDGETGYKLTVVKTKKNAEGDVLSTRTDEVFMGIDLIPTASNGTFISNDATENWDYQGTYTGRKISVVANAHTITDKTYEKVLPQSYYFDGQAYPVFLRAFPLAADYTALIYLVMANGTTYDGVNLTVTEEPVTVRNGEGETLVQESINAFKVVLAPLNTAAGTVTLWYDKTDKNLLCMQETGDVTTTYYSVLPPA